MQIAADPKIARKAKYVVPIAVMYASQIANVPKLRSALKADVSRGIVIAMLIAQEVRSANNTNAPVVAKMPNVALVICVCKATVSQVVAANAMIAPSD